MSTFTKSNHRCVLCFVIPRFRRKKPTAPAVSTSIDLDETSSRPNSNTTTVAVGRQRSPTRLAPTLSLCRQNKAPLPPPTAPRLPAVMRSDTPQQTTSNLSPSTTEDSVDIQPLNKGKGSAKAQYYSYNLPTLSETGFHGDEWGEGSMQATTNAMLGVSPRISVRSRSWSWSAITPIKEVVEEEPAAASDNSTMFKQEVAGAIGVTIADSPAQVTVTPAKGDGGVEEKLADITNTPSASTEKAQDVEEGGSSSESTDTASLKASTISAIAVPGSWIE